MTRRNASGTMKKFKKLLKQGDKQRMSAADWKEIQKVLGADAGPGTRRKAKNPAIAVKAVRVKNFTGTISNVRGKTVVKGRSKGR